MDDFSENQGEFTAEESTVFSAPAEHKDENIKSPKKRKVLAVIAAALAVLMLVGGTLAIIKLIPEKDDTDNTSSELTVSVINFDKSKFESVTVKNTNGEFLILPAKESDDQIKWHLDGISADKISADKTEDIVSAAANISATMEITKKTFGECGLENASVRVDVASNELGNYYILFGDISPDNSGVYLYSSVDEKIYLVASDLADSFVFSELDLANTDSVSAVSADTGSDKYVDENGTLISFDKLEISGAQFKNSIVITSVDEDDNIGLAYKTVSPVSRYADTESVSKFFSAFSSGISVSGVYSFDSDKTAQKQFKLDNADVVLKLTVAGQSWTYRFALQEDGFYALFGDGMDTIKKVSASAAEFLGLGEKDIYNKAVYIRSLSELKNMSFILNDSVYSFNISDNGEDSEERFAVSLGNKKITSENYQNFYMQFVSMMLIDFQAGATSPADLTVKITDNSGAVTAISFIKASATEYYCAIDNKSVGKITAAAYNKLIRNIKTVSENKNVEN